MPLSSSTAPRTREKTPVPMIHSLVRPPLRTEGARSAAKKKRKEGEEEDRGGTKMGRGREGIREELDDEGDRSNT